MSLLNTFYLNIENFNYPEQQIIKPLLNNKGHLNPFKPLVFFRTKVVPQELIVEGIFIKVFKTLYDLRLSVLYIPYNNPFYNTLQRYKHSFTKKEYQKMIDVIDTISNQILKQITRNLTHV